MWIAKDWKDYEVLDSSKGEKLERWGKYILVRPDPQVIWDTPRNHAGWRKRNAHYHRSSKGGGSWEIFDLPERWSIKYKDLTFNLQPFSFKHTGLFPEQAVNWDWFSEKIRNEKGRQIKSLISLLIREAPPWQRQRPEPRLHMWTHPRAWFPGLRKMPPHRALKGLR